MRILRFLGSGFGLTRARVSGDSMAPTFKDGDILLVRIFKERPRDLRLLQVVLVERESQPGIHYIKRIQKIHGDGYWVEGDNRDPEVELRMNDSRAWGYIGSAEIRGRVLFRLNRVRRNLN